MDKSSSTSQSEDMGDSEETPSENNYNNDDLQVSTENNSKDTQNQMEKEKAITLFKILHEEFEKVHQVLKGSIIDEIQSIEDNPTISIIGQKIDY